jgi:adenine-specific DNA glycosylase
VISALSVVADKEESRTPCVDENWSRVIEELGVLRESLENSDVMSIKLVRQFFEQQNNDSFNQALKTLEGVVESYDFDAALVHLVELQEIARRQLAG